MSSARYRRLLTNLPSMAVVVNSFHSQDVQLQVYEVLMDALEDATETSDDSRKSSNDASSGSSSGRKSSSKSSKLKETSAVSDSALADVVEGDSIHSIAAD